MCFASARSVHRWLIVILGALCFSWSHGRLPPSVSLPQKLPHGRADSPAHEQVEVRLNPLGSVVIVAIDGVRWQEIFYGDEATEIASGDGERFEYDPIANLRERMQASGAVIGAPQAASVFSVAGPSYVSLPGYTQLFCGKADVACRDNGCARTPVPTIVDAVGEHYGGFNAVVVTSWPDIERAAVAHDRHALISAGRQGGEGRSALLRTSVGVDIAAGASVHAYPGLGGYRPDEHTQRVAYSVLQDLRPALLFVGLGDTDEYAHRGEYEAYLHSLRSIDQWLERLMQLGDELTDSGHPVTFFITTDHGRNASFNDHGGTGESARTWLIGVGAAIRARGMLPATAQLEDVAPTVASLLRVALPQSTGRVLNELL